MTREERQSRLKAFITCLKCEVSGTVCDDNCPIAYEAGNMGEIIENLEAISKVLEQEPILEKIIAEINAHKKELKTMAESDDWYVGKLRGHECDIEVIDKYRAESEEE